MKSKVLYFICVLVAVMVCSCSGNDYKNAIPSDSDVVVMVNLNNIAEKADIANSKALELAKENMGIVVNGKDKKKALDLFDNPAGMGIDFRQPACAFHRADGSYGLVMKVADDDDLEDFLQMLRGNNVVSKAVERDGVKCCKLLDEIALVYDDHAVMLYANSMMQASEKEMKAAVALMKQDEEHSYKATYTFDMDVEGKDIMAISNNVRKGMEEIIPKNVPVTLFSRLTQTASMLTINFENGKLAMQAELLPFSESDKAAIKEMESHVHKINGIYHAYDTSFVPVWAYMGLDGKWLLKEIKANPAVKEYLFMLERCIDIEQMIAAVDGDVVVSFDPNKDFAVAALGQVTNENFLKDIDYWTESMKEYGATMDRVSPTDYCLHAEGKKLFWGMLNHNLYLSTIGRPEHDTGKMLDQLIGSDRLEDYWFYARIDGEVMQKDRYVSLGAVQKKMAFESIVIKSDKICTMTIEVNMKEKSRNLLKEWLE